MTAISPAARVVARANPGGRIRMPVLMVHDSPGGTKEQYDDAARGFAKLVELAGPGFSGYLGYSYAKAGREGSALAILGELTVTVPVPSFQPFLVLLGLGRFEEALTWLEKAFEERAGSWFPYIRQECVFDPLRGYPRFQDLVRRLNFPEY